MHGTVDQQSATRETANPAERYDSKTIWFHWLTATLVVVLWGIAQINSFLPRGPIRRDIWSIHVTLGIVLLLVFLGRIVWRASKGSPSLPTNRKLLDLASKAAHWMLYLLLATTITLGVGSMLARGWNFFDLVKIPAYDPTDTKRVLAHTLTNWHDLAANSIMVLALLHALAALFHHYVLKDGVLRRMLASK